MDTEAVKLSWGGSSPQHWGLAGTGFAFSSLAGLGRILCLSPAVHPLGRLGKLGRRGGLQPDPQLLDSWELLPVTWLQVLSR